MISWDEEARSRLSPYPTLFFKKLGFLYCKIPPIHPQRCPMQLWTHCSMFYTFTFGITWLVHDTASVSLDRLVVHFIGILKAAFEEIDVLYTWYHVHPQMYAVWSAGYAQPRPMHLRTNRLLGHQWASLYGFRVNDLQTYPAKPGYSHCDVIKVLQTMKKVVSPCSDQYTIYL